MSKIGNKNDNNSSVPTLAEYITQQIAAKRAAALDKSRTRTEPTIPLVERKLSPEEINLRNKIGYAKINQLNDELIQTIDNKQAANIKKEIDKELDNLKKTTTLCQGASCIYTATDNYGKQYRVSGNQTFAANPSKYGFKEVPNDSIQPSDIVQFISRNTPYHAVIYDSKDATGENLYNYSDGGYGAKNIKIKKHMPGNNYKTYTFVGTPADSTQWINEYKQKYGNGMRCGGRRKAQLGLDVQYGGRAIPISRNMVYFDGNSHEDGGIGVGNKLEVEGGEVGEYKNNTLRVFSSVPFLRGFSPAQLVMGGANPNKVFKAQENFKDRNRINDDGTHYQNGGNIAVEAAKTIGGYLPFIGTALDAYELYKNPSWKQAGWTALGLLTDIFTGGSARAVIKTTRNLKNAKEALSIVRGPITKRIYKDAAVDAIKANTKAKKDVIRDATVNVGQNYVQHITDKYEMGGQKKSNSAIRTEDDKKVSARNRAIYSAVDATSDYPTWWQAVGLGIGSNFKTIINPDSMNYTVTDSVADAAWRKRLGLSYNDKFLIPNKDGSVRLPRNVEMEIPTDTTMLKKRIATNEKFANQSNIVGEDWQIVQAMMKKDKEALEALRKTYKTGEPVVVNEYAHNNRKLSKNGELIDDAINYKSPLNVMRNYTIQYDPKNRKMNYWDTYDFNEFEWGVPGKPFEIRGSVPLKRYGGNMIYTITGNVKNGLMSSRAKAEFGKDVKYPYVDENRRYYINNGAKIYSDGQIVDEKNYSKYYVLRNKNRNFLGYSIDENGNRELAPVFNEKIAKEAYEYSKNKRPQYYAKKRLPIAGSQSIAEKAGLSRSGWSYADSPTFYYVPKINISVPTNYAKAVGDNAKINTSSTPRGRGTKSSKPATSTKPATVEAKQPKLVERPKENLYITGIKNNAVKSPIMIGMEKISANPASPSTGGGTQSKDGNWVPQYNLVTGRNLLGVGTNLAGHIASYFANRDILDKYPMPTKPVMTPTVKLKTRVNINPDLTNSKESELMGVEATNRNTSSSNTTLARNQRIMNESRDARNKLYAYKENAETQLINQDKLNRQGVYARNVAAYNDWLNKTYVAKTNKLLGKQQILMNLINGIPMAVNNVLGNIETRKSTNDMIRAIAAANPNGDGRLLGIGDYYTQQLANGKIAKYNKNHKFIKYV